jgi:hypothetical protein
VSRSLPRKEGRASNVPQSSRYLVPVVGDPTRSSHLAATCQLAARDRGRVLALIIGLVPSSLPVGSDVPELWSRLEYEAARVRRFGRELGLEVETVLVLSDSAGAAVVALAEELRSSAICLAYEPGLKAALRRWRDPLWRTILDEAPCPVVLELIRSAEPRAAVQAEPVRGQPLAT